MSQSWRMTRRTALKLLGVGAGALAWPGAWGRVTGGAIRKRSIPSSGEQVPVVGLGTARTFDVGPVAARRAPLEKVLRRFFDHGGRVIDTSPMYGSAETVIGDLLARMDHPEPFYATKVWTEGKESGIRQMEQSAERLDTDVIDLMQVHNLVDWRTHLDTMARWKDEGRIRYTGITDYVVSAFDDLERVMKARDPDWVQLPLSLATPDAADRLLPLAADRGIAVLVNRPFENGRLFQPVVNRELPGWASEFGAESWAQLFLKYILSHPEVTCVIPATSDPEHMVDDMRAGYGPLPDAAQRRRMEKLWAEMA